MDKYLKKYEGSDGCYKYDGIMGQSEQVVVSLCGVQWVQCLDGELPKVVDTLDCPLPLPMAGEDGVIHYITELKMMDLGSQQKVP